MKRFISMMLAFMMVLGIVPVGEMVAFAADETFKMETMDPDKVSNANGKIVSIKGKGFGPGNFKVTDIKITLEGTSITAPTIAVADVLDVGNGVMNVKLPPAVGYVNDAYLTVTLKDKDGINKGSSTIKFSYINDPQISKIITNTEIKILRDNKGNILEDENGKPKREKNTYLEIAGDGFNQPGKTNDVEKIELVSTVGQRIPIQEFEQKAGLIKAKLDGLDSIGFKYDEKYTLEIETVYGGKVEKKDQVIKLAKYDINQLSDNIINAGSELEILGGVFPTAPTVYVGPNTAVVQPSKTNANKITIKVPTSGVEKQNVRVEDITNGVAVTLIGELEVLPEPGVFTVTSIMPNLGHIDGGKEIRIIGTGLTDKMMVKFGDSKTILARLDATESKDGITVLKLKTPSATEAGLGKGGKPKTGPVDVTVTNPSDGGVDIVVNGYRYEAGEDVLIPGRVSPDNGFETGEEVARIDGLNFQKVKTSSGVTVTEEDKAEAVKDTNGRVIGWKFKSKPFIYKDPKTGIDVNVIRERVIKVEFGGLNATFELMDEDDTEISPQTTTLINKETGKQTIKVKTPRISLNPREDTKVDVVVEIKTEYKAVDDNRIVDSFTESEPTTNKYEYKIVPSTPEMKVVSLEEGLIIPSVDPDFKIAKAQSKDHIYVYGLDLEDEAKVYFIKEDKEPIQSKLVKANEGEVVEVITLNGSENDKLRKRIEVKVPEKDDIGKFTIIVENPDKSRTISLKELLEKQGSEENLDEATLKQRQAERRAIQMEIISSPEIKSVMPGYGSTNITDDDGNTVEVNPRVVLKGKTFVLEGEIDGDGSLKTKKPFIYVVTKGIKTIDVLNAHNLGEDKYPQGEILEITTEVDKKLVKLDGQKFKIGNRLALKMPAVDDAGFRDIILINPDGGVARYEDDDAFEYKKPQSRPHIDTVKPDKGSADGNEKIVIEGTGFDYAKDKILVIGTIDGEPVKVDKVERKIRDDKNIEVITITTPKGTPGDKIIQIINEDGGTAEANFKYSRIDTAPKITKIVPNYGGSGAKVTIVGEDFVIQDVSLPEGSKERRESGTRIFLNEVEITNLKILDSKEIVIEIPGGLPVGFKDVRLENPDSANTEVKNGFNYLKPQSKPKINSVEPKEGSIEGGILITIKGSGFQPEPEVYFGHEKGIKPIVNIDGTEIKVTLPKYIIDTSLIDEKDVLVTVINYDGGSDTLDPGFKYKNPESSPIIDSISPNQGPTVGNTTVVIAGKDFRYKDENNNDIYDKGEQIPRVYFGGKEALEVTYGGMGQLIVKTPPTNEKGKVDVMVINHDAGTAISKGGFTYDLSKPTITKIVPGTIHRYGGTSLTVKGTEFMKSEFKNKMISKPIDIEVIFGNESAKKTIIRGSGYAEVELGDLKAIYDTTNPDEPKVVVSSSLTKDAKTFEGKIDENNPLVLELKTSKDTEILEGIKISIEDGQLVLTRRLATHVEWIDNNTLYISTPPMDGIGTRDITIINQDKGTAKGTVEVKNPDSEPKIVNVLRDGEEGIEELVKGIKSKVIYVNAKGGSLIEIEGSDFRKPVKVQVDEALEVDIKRSPGEEPVSSKLSFTVPLGVVKDEHLNKEYRISVENEDGGSAISDKSDMPIYIKFFKGESNPQITSVSPRSGPSKGGTKVTIKGNDFRTKMQGFSEPLKIYFDDGVKIVEVGAGSIKVKDKETIEVISPPHKAGKVEIKVKNPDETMSQSKEKDNIFTYVSDPKITSILDPNNGDIRKSILSIDGGETIKIVGNDFLRKTEGENKNLRVVFSPKLEKIEPGGDNKSEDVITMLGVDYKLISGDTLELSDKGASDSKDKKPDLELVDGNTILVNKTPAGKIGSRGVIVINPDGSSTPIYDIPYGTTEISGPREVRASLINNEYIRINWDPVTDKDTANDGKTVQYEVYVIEGNSRQFIGTTGTTGFIFRDIKADKTKYYKFLVRSIGKYGSSKPIEESMSNEVRVDKNSGPKDNDGELGEKTKVDKSGNTANVTVGNDAFGQAGEYVIDTTRGVLSGSADVVISISAKTVIDQRNKRIKVIAKDYALSFNLSVFENATVIANRSNPNAGVKFEVSPNNTNFDLAENKGDTILSSKYFLRGRTFVGASSNEVENLNGKMSFALDYDNNMAKARRLEDNVRLAKYDKYKKAFKDISKKSSYGTSSGEITELGAYAVIGSRR